MIYGSQKHQQHKKINLKSFVLTLCVCVCLFTPMQIVKAERNKTHAQILLLGQVGAELSEKTKILANEIEILRTASDTKEQ